MCSRRASSYLPLLARRRALFKPLSVVLEGRHPNNVTASTSKKVRPILPEALTLARSWKTVVPSTGVGGECCPGVSGMHNEAHCRSEVGGAYLGNPMRMLAGIWVATVLVVSARAADTNWVQLFNGRDLSNWDRWLGVKGGGYSDSKSKAAPLGLNNDPLGVFTVVEKDGAPAIC